MNVTTNNQTPGGSVAFQDITGNATDNPSLNAQITGLADQINLRQEKTKFGLIHSIYTVDNSGTITAGITLRGNVATTYYCFDLSDSSTITVINGAYNSTYNVSDYNGIKLSGGVLHFAFSTNSDPTVLTAYVYENTQVVVASSSGGAVKSVNGQTGDVTLNTGNIPFKSDANMNIESVLSIGENVIVGSGSKGLTIQSNDGLIVPNGSVRTADYHNLWFIDNAYVSYGDSGLELFFNSNTRPYLQDGSTKRFFAYLEDIEAQTTFGNKNQQMIFQSMTPPIYRDPNGVETNVLTGKQFSYNFNGSVATVNPTVTINQSSVVQSVYDANGIGVINFEIDLTTNDTTDAQTVLCSIDGTDPVPTGVANLRFACVSPTSPTAPPYVTPISLVENNRSIDVVTTTSIPIGNIVLVSSANVQRVENQQ